MSLKMAAWRPQGSILKPPGLDFNGFWERFFQIFGLFRDHLSNWLFHRHNAKKAKVWPKCSQNVRISLPHVPSAMQSCRCKPYRHGNPQRSCTQMGRRRWPPLGGFQSAGHRRCANGVPNSFPTGSVESQLANLDILSRNSI